MSGGLIYTYEPGTSTAKPTYSDSDGTVSNENPVELDSRGEASIYLDGSYKIVVKDSDDVTVYTVDNFTGAAGFPVNDSVSIVQDPTDNTKQVRIDAGSVTTGTTRVLTMPDRDVTPGDTASVTTGNIPQKSAAGAFTDSPLSTDGSAVGVNASLAAWSAGWSVIQYDGTTSVGESAAGAGVFGHNVYNDGSDKYLTTAAASRVYHLNGSIVSEVAASGSADAAISWSQAHRILNNGTITNGGTDEEPHSSDSAGFVIKANSALRLSTSASEPVWIHTQGSTGAGNLQRFSVSDGAGGDTSVGSISTDGTSTAYNTTSDYRLKTNVTPVSAALDRVRALNPVRFNFIGSERTIDGFLAHEAQAVIPEAVTGTKDEVDEDGNPIYQGIDQSKLVPLLTAALQEEISKREGLAALLVSQGVITQEEVDAL